MTKKAEQALELFKVRIESNSRNENRETALELLKSTYDDFITMTYCMYSYDFITSKCCDELSDNAKVIYENAVDETYRKMERE